MSSTANLYEFLRTTFARRSQLFQSGSAPEGCPQAQPVRSGRVRSYRQGQTVLYARLGEPAQQPGVRWSASRLCWHSAAETFLRCPPRSLTHSAGIPFPGNIIPSNRLDPVSVNLANTYMPLPNQPGTINYALLVRREDKLGPGTRANRLPLAGAGSVLRSLYGA